MNMSDEKLLDKYDEARSLMSYYNAAEGSWSSETEARAQASANLNEIRKELAARGLVGRPGNYLC